VPNVRRRARLAAVGACLVGALLLSSCRAHATVAIRVARDGTGTVGVTVVLDRAARLALAGAALSPAVTATPTAAAAALPDVPLADLRGHGWTVSSWHPSAVGGATVVLSKGFTGEAGLASVLAELDGRDGALRDAHVTRSRALLRDRDSVSLVADLQKLDTGVADDQVLAQRLRGAGVDVAALDAGLRSHLGSSFDLTVTVSLPDGAHTLVTVAPGATRTVAAAETSTHFGRFVALLVAAGAALLGLLLFAAAGLNARRTRGRR
jgi:hypothetical protein